MSKSIPSAVAGGRSEACPVGADDKTQKAFLKLN
jgi:hypothetical protein